MRPFIAVRLTLKQKTDAFRVRVFMYVSLRVRALSKCAFAYLRARGARAHAGLSLSPHVSLQHKTSHDINLHARK